MSHDPEDRTASLMTPARLAQLKVRPAVAVSPAAWLDQLASDAGSSHARRLAELRRQLEAQLRERNDAALRDAVAALAAALQALDLSLVEPRGWLARATGKGREAAATFAAQWTRLQRAAEDLADEVRTALKRQAAHGAAGDRMLVDFAVELRAVEKIMDQGARWLQDMRNQLQSREAQGGDAEVLQKIREDSARCELLVARLKQLRGAASAAQQVLDPCRAAPARRATLLASVQEAVQTHWPACQRQLAPLAEEAAASGCVRQGLEAGRQAREQGAALLAQAGADCAALVAQEQALATQLAAAQAPLQDAA